MNRDNDDICGVLIPNRERLTRQDRPVIGVDMASGPALSVPNFFTPSMNDLDVADSYVPFEPPQAPGADSINTESMLGLVLIAILMMGLTAYLFYVYFDTTIGVYALAGAQ